MSSELRSSAECLEAFDAEAWLEVNEPFMRATARDFLYNKLPHLSRQERMAYFIDDLVEHFLTKAAFNVNAFRDKVEASRGYLATSVRNAILDWVRKYSCELMFSDIQASSRARLDAPGGDSEALERHIVRNSSSMLTVSSAEEEFLGADLAERRFRRASRLIQVFNEGIPAHIERLATSNGTLARRLQHKIVSAVLDALLARPCIFQTLVAENGRDACKDATAEARRLAVELKADVRTIQNRRAEWLQELRQVLRPEIAMLKRYLTHVVYADFRAGQRIACGRTSSWT